MELATRDRTLHTTSSPGKEISPPTKKQHTPSLTSSLGFALDLKKPD
jgi:hypothetical protein